MLPRRVVSLILRLATKNRSLPLPGSRNLPYAELLLNGETMLAPELLRQRFAAAGVDAGSAVVTSCGSGLTAAVLTLGLVVAGLPSGARKTLTPAMTPARSTSRREGSSARELRSAIRIESTPSSAESHSVLDLVMRATCRLPRSVALDAQDQLKGASERRTSVEITGSFGRQY